MTEPARATFPEAAASLEPVPSPEPTVSVETPSPETPSPATLAARLDACMSADAVRLRRRLQALRRRGRGADARQWSKLDAAIDASAARRATRAASAPEAGVAPDLPITAKAEAIARAVADHPVTLVVGATGSGKSTQLPKICLGAGRGIGATIGHTQPRRIAARSVAARVAAELGTDLGRLVGYQVRFGRQVAPDTLVKLMTDGILLAEIQRDRDLRAYDTLIIDEAHERTLNVDFVLGYLRTLLRRRPELRVVVASATLEVEKLRTFFDGAPVIEVEGRTFPVEIRYRPGTEGEDVPDKVAGALAEIRDEPGDVLVFLSGEREIRETEARLGGMGLADTELFPLHARMSAERQQALFAPCGRRRVVLATNVAETSLTVPGVRFVIDAGTARVSRYAHRTGVQRLPVEPIARASAEQRAGRCGRIGPGVCIRLYDEADFAARPTHAEPEIRRSDLAAVLLRMLSLGLHDVDRFPFIDPPDRRHVNDGLRLLRELGAVDGGGLTKLGRRLARFPLDPRIGRMLLEADALGCVAEVLVIASFLSVPDPRERRPESRSGRRRESRAGGRPPMSSAPATGGGVSSSTAPTIGKGVPAPPAPVPGGRAPMSSAPAIGESVPAPSTSATGEGVSSSTAPIIGKGVPAPPAAVPGGRAPMSSALAIGEGVLAPSTSATGEGVSSSTAPIIGRGVPAPPAAVTDRGVTTPPAPVPGGRAPMSSAPATGGGVPAPSALVIGTARAGPSPSTPVVRTARTAPPASARAGFANPSSDFLGIVDLWRRFRSAVDEPGGSARGFCRRHSLSPARMRDWADVHGQIREICRELGIRPRGLGTASPGRIHRALLAGLLRCVGARTPEGEYAGLRGTTFRLAPGSALHPAVAPWIVAAEVVETGRPYAFMAGRIRAEWVEKAAGDLVRRSHFDAHWDARRAEPMVFEQVALYGLTLIARRQVRYAPVSREDAREVFLRSGLVENGYACGHAFAERNARVLARLRAVEHKLRSPGALVGDDAVFAFYDARVPRHVVDGRSFEEWWSGLGEDGARGLELRPEDVVAPGASLPSEAAFPDVLRAGDQAFDLAYRFAPGEDDDGLTVTIPRDALADLDPGRFEWLVPGMLEEKTLALLRALPKSLRRSVMPLGEVAREFVAGTGAAGMGATGTDAAGTGAAGTGAAGTDAAGTGAAGTGAAGTGAAGTGAAGMGAAGTGAAGTGVAGTGAAGTGVAGTGAAGTDAAGTGAAGTGAAGTGAAGTGAAGTDAAGTDAAGAGVAGTSSAGAGAAGRRFGDGSLRGALARFLDHSRGVHVPPDAWSPERLRRVLPAHLHMRFEIVMRDGTVLGRSRRFEALERRSAERSGQAGRTLPASGGPTHVAWTFGAVPAEAEDRSGGGFGTVFPALRDVGTGVVVEHFQARGAAEHSHRGGLVRLFSLAMRHDSRESLRRLPGIDELCLLYAMIAPAPGWVETPPAHAGRPAAGTYAEARFDLVERTVAKVFVARAGGIREAKRFGEVLAAGRSAFAGALEATAGAALSILRAARAVRQLADAPDLHAPPASLADVQRQLDGLVHHGFLATTPDEAFASLPRYLEGLRMRLGKLRRGGADDERRLAGVLPLQQRLESKARDVRARGRRAPELACHRWMLEEYRVSVFAQELGTAFRVSRKRLDEQWSRIAAL